MFEKLRPQVQAFLDRIVTRASESTSAAPSSLHALLAEYEIFNPALAAELSQLIDDARRPTPNHSDYTSWATLEDHWWQVRQNILFRLFGGWSPQRTLPATSGYAHWWITFSPDGTQLAVVMKQEVRIWDVASGGELLVGKVDTGSYGSLAFSPDGTLLAVGELRKVTLWDVASGRKVRTLEGHSNVNGVKTVTFSPDGILLFSVDGGGCKLWDVASWRGVRTLDCYPLSLAFSPDGTLLAAQCISGGNFEVRIWDVASGRGLFSVKCDRGDYSLAFSPDGTRLAVVVKKEVRIWDVADWREVCSLEWSDQGKAVIKQLAFSPDGTLLAWVGQGDDEVSFVKLWDVAYLREVQVLESEARSLAFSPDSTRLAISGKDGMTLWLRGAIEKKARLQRGASSDPANH